MSAKARKALWSSSPIRITRTEHDDKTGQDTEREIPYMKGYTVFNVEQIDGLPEIYYAKAAPTLDPVARIERAEALLRRHAARPSSTAATAPTTRRNSITCRCRLLRLSAMPRATTARSPHELSHWTKHPSRLDRDLGRKIWGDAGYAAEELVAELGSAFLCADLESLWNRARKTPPTSPPGWRFSRTITRDFHGRRTRAERRRLPESRYGSFGGNRRGRLIAFALFPQL